MTARRRAVAFVVGAGAAFATSSPLARLARPAHPLAIAVGRTALAALLLGLVDRRPLRAALAGMSRATLAGILGVGALLGLHFALFLQGLDGTSLPAAVTLVSLEPLSVVLWGWAMHRLRPTGLELVGVALATAGAVGVAQAAGTGEHRLGGDLLVVGAVVVYGAYVNAARFFREAIEPRAYAALVYAGAAVFCAIALLCIGTNVPLHITPHALGAIALLALVPTMVGHTAVQAAARHASPALVALVSPGETLGSLCIAAFLMHAAPTGWELGGAAVIVAGVACGIVGGSRRQAAVARVEGVAPDRREP